MSSKIITTAAQKARHLLESFAIYDDIGEFKPEETIKLAVKCVDEMLGCVGPHNADEIKYLNSVKKELLKNYKTW